MVENESRPPLLWWQWKAPLDFCFTGVTAKWASPQVENFLYIFIVHVSRRGYMNQRPASKKNPRLGPNPVDVKVPGQWWRPVRRNNSSLVWSQPSKWCDVVQFFFAKNIEKFWIDLLAHIFGRLLNIFVWNLQPYLRKWSSIFQNHRSNIRQNTENHNAGESSLCIGWWPMSIIAVPTDLKSFHEYFLRFGINETESIVVFFGLEGSLVVAMVLFGWFWVVVVGLFGLVVVSSWLQRSFSLVFLVHFWWWFFGLQAL